MTPFQHPPHWGRAHGTRHYRLFEEGHDAEQTGQDLKVIKALGHVRHSGKVETQTSLRYLGIRVTQTCDFEVLFKSVPII